MIHLCQRLQTSSSQTEKSEFKKSKKFAWGDILSVHNFAATFWYSSLIRYNATAKEWTVKYAMWQPWGSTSAMHPRTPHTTAVVSTAQPNLSQLRCFIGLRHFLHPDYTWFTCFTVYCIFPEIGITLLLVLVKWPVVFSSFKRFIKTLQNLFFFFFALKTFKSLVENVFFGTSKAV